MPCATCLVSTGIPIFSSGRTSLLRTREQGAGYRLFFPACEVTVDGPSGPPGGGSTFSLRTDAPSADLPDGWIQRPFPGNLPT